MPTFHDQGTLNPPHLYPHHILWTPPFLKHPSVSKENTCHFHTNLILVRSYAFFTSQKYFGLYTVNPAPGVFEWGSGFPIERVSDGNSSGWWRTACGPVANRGPDNGSQGWSRLPAPLSSRSSLSHPSQNNVSGWPLFSLGGGGRVFDCFSRGGGRLAGLGFDPEPELAKNSKN